MTKGTKDVVQNPVAESIDAEVVEFRAQFDDRSPLDEIVREGARKMLQAAIEAEVDEVVGLHSDRRDDSGRRLVVRNVSRGAIGEPVMGAFVVPPLRAGRSHSFFHKPYRDKAIGLAPKRMLGDPESAHEWPFQSAR